MSEVLTDNEIIKVSEELKEMSELTPPICEYEEGVTVPPFCKPYEEFQHNVKVALDLINRYEARIKELEGKVVIQKGLIDRQQAEVERLQKLLDDKCDRCIAKERTEAVKGFAEIVKANLDDFYYTGEDGLVETGALIDILVNQELRDLNNVQCATKKLHVGTVEKTRALFQAMVNKFMSLKDLYVIVDGEYLPWEPAEEVEHLFGMSISGDNDEIDKETDRVVKELVGEDNG